MKKLILVFLLGMIQNSFLTQTCGPPSQTAMLNAQNADALISNGQGMWENQNTNDANYYTPSGSGKSVFYASGFWIGGLDESQNLHLAATKYNNSGHDFFAGPITTDGSATPTNCDDYDRLFKITRIMVETHLAYYNALGNGTANEEFPFGYDIPLDILEYPAQGNTSIGEAEYLAPFFDYNNDGVYDANSGDCPLFSGMGIVSDCNTCDQLQGDVAYFWINNDTGNYHTESEGEQLGIEIHNTAYAFPNSMTSQISKSTFYQKKIINRSNLDYHDVYIGIYVDADIGNSTDDYVGCDIARKIGYAYNGDPLDEPISSSPGYGANPPAAGVVFLNEPLAISNNIDDDNDGIIDNENLGMSGFIYYNISGVGVNDPDYPSEYYYYLKGYWKDGAPLTYGGNGHDNNTGVVTSHMFPDDFVLDGFDPWTEPTVGTPPGDRRFLMTAGPFDLNAGEDVCIHFATVVGFPTENLTAIEVMKNNADYISNQFDVYCNSMPTAIVSHESMSSEITWNPQSNLLSIKTTKNESIQLTILNSIGQIVVENSFEKQITKTLNQLKPGVYIIKIQDSKGNMTTKKINKIQ